MGFNSCYHLTDVVSFVSGRNLAIFDPHCTVLPSISSAEPGKRIDFVASHAADEHPDQFEPYQARTPTRCASVIGLKGMIVRDMAEGTGL